MSESSQEIGPNPNGRPYPVFYQMLTPRRDDTIKSIKTVQIVGTEVANFPYKAVDPKTGNEIRLGKTQWVEIYHGLLNKEPPYDLVERVRLYYQIRNRKKQEKEMKSTPVETSD